MVCIYSQSFEAFDYLDKGKPAERLSAQSYGSSLPPHSAKDPKIAGLPKGFMSWESTWFRAGQGGDREEEHYL